MSADFIEKNEIKLVLNGFFVFEIKLVFLLSEKSDIYFNLKKKQIFYIKAMWKARDVAYRWHKN